MLFTKSMMELAEQMHESLQGSHYKKFDLMTDYEARILRAHPNKLSEFDKLARVKLVEGWTDPMVMLPRLKEKFPDFKNMKCINHSNDFIESLEGDMIVVFNSDVVIKDLRCDYLILFNSRVRFDTVTVNQWGMVCCQEFTATTFRFGSGFIVCPDLKLKNKLLSRNHELIKVEKNHLGVDLFNAIMEEIIKKHSKDLGGETIEEEEEPKVHVQPEEPEDLSEDKTDAQSDEKVQDKAKAKEPVDWAAVEKLSNKLLKALLESEGGEIFTNMNKAEMISQLRLMVRYVDGLDLKINHLLKQKAEQHNQNQNTNKEAQPEAEAKNEDGADEFQPDADPTAKKAA